MTMQTRMNLLASEARDARPGDMLDVEVRFSAVGDDGAIEGRAVRWDTVDTYGTTFAATAFASVRGTVPMLWSHDPANVIGSWSSVEVRRDALVVRGKLNLAVAKAQEVRSLLQAKDVSGLSIGFSTVKDERKANGVRRITEARLHEISIVAFPSVPGSGVTSVRTETSRESAAAFVNACRKAALALKGK
jgi:HK97 family phage prohead protease